MTWDQWIEVHIDNRSSSETYEIKELHRGSGKLYRAGDNSRAEIEPSDIENKPISPQHDYSFGHSGRAGAWVGCDGKFSVFIKGTNTKIFSMSYDCPYWTSQNSLAIYDVDSNYLVGPAKGGSLYSSAIGSVWIKIKKV